MRRSIAALALSLSLSVVALAQGAAQGTNDAPPDATITLSGGSVAAGVGFAWGNGNLVFQGRNHKVRLSGLSVLDVGAAGYTASGAVYNLHRIEDFGGDYVGISGGAALVAGRSVTYLRNENGVVIKLDAATQGLRFNLSGNGVNMEVVS